MKRKTFAQIMYEQMQVPAIDNPNITIIPVNSPIVKELVPLPTIQQLSEKEKNIYLKGEFPKDHSFLIKDGKLTLVKDDVEPLEGY